LAQIAVSDTSHDIGGEPWERGRSFTPVAPAVKIGDLVYTSGLIAGDPETGLFVEGGFAEQAARVLDNLKLVLEAAGSSLDKVAKVNVFFADIQADFATFNEIYSRYFPSDCPARTAVQTPLAFDFLRIEVEAIATT
jgi:2-iminobutanoate/2-iminopropanoate deaminase